MYTSLFVFITKKFIYHWFILPRGADAFCDSVFCLYYFLYGIRCIFVFLILEIAIMQNVLCLRNCI